MIPVKKILFISLVIFSATSSLSAKLSEEQVYALFNQANENFRQANSASDTDQAQRLYEKAILGFEKIVDQGRIKNAKLYYNLGNAYLLKGQLGKAILNYRKAENIDDSDENIQKNLAFARSRRVDKITVKTEKRVMQTLFFWHYDLSIKTRFLLTCVLFGIICISVAMVVWLGKNNTFKIVAVIFTILMFCLIISVAVECTSKANTFCGVITASQVIARQGDGENYTPSFKEPLHEGTEFELLEERPGWYHIKLSDDSEGWIPINTADLI